MSPIIAYWVRGDEYAALAGISSESVRRIYPNADIRIIRDDGSRPAMVANLDAQLSVLWWARGPVLFLDVDTILRRPFPFDDNAKTDLYVTWRDHVGHSKGEKVSGVAELMPYNYGVIGCIASDRIYDAFLWMRAQVLCMSAQHQQWYGNQLALASLVGQRPDSGEAEKTVRVRWAHTDSGLTALKVKQLPCDIWNFTPEAEGEDVSEKGIIHLKGNRKDLMQHYARVA